MFDTMMHEEDKHKVLLFLIKLRRDLMEKLKNDLCCHAMKDQWSEVLKMLQKDTWLCLAKITATGDTVLHLAVYAPEQSTKEVAKIVYFCQEQYIVDHEEGRERSNVLGVANSDGNTPLHLAASIGNVEMCKMIVGVNNYSLIAKRNNAGETPMFLAALYGRRNAFLWLHYYYMRWPRASPSDIAHCIRKNNDTILHCAIAHEHFDVAIEILYLYKDLVDPTSENDEGLTPLQILAEKPSAFKSGTLLGRPFGHIAYYFLGNMKKEKATTEEELRKSERKSWVTRLKDHVVRKWKSEAKENKMVKTIVWVLDHFDLVGQSIRDLVGVRKKRQKHDWSRQIMDQLLKHGSPSDMPAGTTPSFLLPTTSRDGKVKIESPLVIAAKNGVIEMVKAILENFPSTVSFDKVTNEEGKNIVLVAVENRQTDVYKFLCKREILRLTGSLFKQVDEEGNSALHLAASYGGERNCEFPGEVLLMQWEYKWFQYVRNSMPPGVFEKYNHKSETPDEIFKETHKELSTKDEEWLSKTSGACSVVATLIATVAFASAATVPGGVDNGLPVFLHNSVLQFFLAMSLTALLFSLLATVLFLSIVTARYHSVHFYIDLPFALLLGMSAMFIAIFCMWVSFCVGHSFLLVHPARKVYLPIYIITSIPGTIFVISKFPVYWNLLITSFDNTPAPSYRTVPARPKPPRTTHKLRCGDVSSKDVKICEDSEK